MERLKHVRDVMLCCVESQLGDLKNVDAAELGEVVDMAKDMEEAMYYHMKRKKIECEMEKEKEEESHKKHISYPMPREEYLPSHVYRDEMHRDYDRDRGKMYYSGQIPQSNSNMMRDSYPVEIRDVREGRSPMSRKSYMETKEAHKGESAQMKELEKYLHELTEDLTEMIEDASPEEKQILQQKLTSLAAKIK